MRTKHLSVTLYEDEFAALEAAGRALGLESKTILVRRLLEIAYCRPELHQLPEVKETKRLGKIRKKRAMHEEKPNPSKRADYI